MYRPSALITGVWLSALPGVLSAATEISFVLGVHPFCTPRQVSRNMICVVSFSCAENAPSRPSWLSAGVSSATAAAPPVIVNVCGVRLGPPPKPGQATRHTPLGGLITLIQGAVGCPETYGS